MNTQDLKIFYMIISIFISLLVLSIFERHILTIISNKEEKINLLYLNKIINTIHNGKIILMVAFSTIFMILINPISLLRIFNPYIFDALSYQFVGIISSIDRKELCKSILPNKYLENKPSNKIKKLDKTLNEIVFNKSSDQIYERIKKDFEGEEESLCNLIKSIDVDNKLFKLETKEIEDFFKKMKTIKETDLKDPIEYLQENQKEPLTNIDSYDILVKIWINNKQTGNDKERITLDTTRSSKFEIINKHLTNTYTNEFTDSKNFIINTNNSVLLFSIYIISDTICHIYNLTKLFTAFASIKGQNTNNSENKYLIAQEGNYYVVTNEDTENDIEALNNDSNVNNTKTFFLVYNILILFIIAQLLNNKEWLNNTGLVTTESKKISVLILFCVSFICKSIFIFNRYVLLDTYFLINLINLVINMGLGNYIYKYISNADDNNNLLTFIKNEILFSDKHKYFDSSIFHLMFMLTILVYGM